MELGVPAAPEPRPGEDEARLRAHGARVEQLLDELRTSSGPATWDKVEELVGRLVELYGAGLERLLGHMAAVGGLGESLAARVGADELLASLLLVHGLHPEPVEARVRRALDRVAPRLGLHAGGVELVEIDGRGVARLRFRGSCHGCRSSAATLDGLVRAAIEEAAPELAGVEEVDG
jgi:Fe-S cluster biogenesis protein NfuA